MTHPDSRNQARTGVRAAKLDDWICPVCETSKWLAENDIVVSVGSRGDSFDNALAESIIGLYKTELVRNRGTVARPRRPRVRHFRMGRLVQPPVPRNRPYPPGRT